MDDIKKILLIEDDAQAREELSELLVDTDEFDVFEAEDAQSALVRAGREIFDLVLLDVGLPDMDGRELCKRLRDRGIRVPILMLTAFESESDAILGLDSGANDYVSKPFSFQVLLARIRSHIKAHQRAEDAEFSIGDSAFRASMKLLVTGSGREIRLTEKETSVLKFLHRCPNGHASKETLLREVWGYSQNAKTHTLETHIYRLRRKFESNPSRPEHLVTKGSGYSLIR